MYNLQSGGITCVNFFCQPAFQLLVELNVFMVELLFYLIDVRDTDYGNAENASISIVI